MFADDIVICRASMKQVQEHLGMWRYGVESRGMKDKQGQVSLQGAELDKVQDFKYLGLTATKRVDMR